MCMGGPGCGGGSKKSGGNSYTPKKMGGGKASKGSYTPRTGRATLGGFGKPSIGKVSFSGRGR